MEGIFLADGENFPSACDYEPPTPAAGLSLFLEPTFLTGSLECIIIKPWPAASTEFWLTFPVFVKVEKAMQLLDWVLSSGGHAS